MIKIQEIYACHWTTSVQVLNTSSLSASLSHGNPSLQGTSPSSSPENKDLSLTRVHCQIKYYIFVSTRVKNGLHNYMSL